MLTEYEINRAMRLRPQGFENMVFDDEAFTRCFLACFDDSKETILCIGEAGSGKTQILKAVAAHYGDKALVMTLTGMGAHDLSDDRITARTIHLGLGLPVRPYYNDTDVYRRPIEAMRGKDVIILDEVSLVNANLLDTIIRHKRLAEEGRRKHIRLLVFGDPFQCSPVLKEDELAPVLRDYPNLRNNWAFSRSEQFIRLQPEMHVLKKVYRQKDPEFRGVLSRIRIGTATESDVRYINQHVSDSPGKHSLILATTHKEVQAINEAHMNLLLESQKPVSFDAEYTLGDKMSGVGGFTPHLDLCRGERVMCTRNHYDEDGNPLLRNGQMGTIIDFRYQDGSMLPVVRADDGEVLTIPYVEFEESVLMRNEEGKYDYIPTARAMMIPLTASWATTYMKAQGKTVQDVYLKIPDNRPMEGLIYMGLSRVRSAKGLALSSEISRDMFIVPEYAREFLPGPERTR